jgi:hypothetical protein
MLSALAMITLTGVTTGPDRLSNATAADVAKRWASGAIPELDRLFTGGTAGVRGRVCVSATVAGAEYRALAAQFMPATRAYFESLGFVFQPLELEGDPHTRWREGAYPTLIEVKWEGMGRALDQGCRAIIWLDTDLVLMRRLNASEVSDAFGLEDPATHAALPFVPIPEAPALGVITMLKDSPHSRELIGAILGTSRTRRFPDGTPYDRWPVGYEQTMLQHLVRFQSGRYTRIPIEACQLLPIPIDLQDSVRIAPGGTGAIGISGVQPIGGGAAFAGRLFFQTWGFNGLKHIALRSVCDTCEDCGLSTFAREVVSALRKARERGFRFACNVAPGTHPGNGGCSWRPIPQRRR